MKIFVAVFDVRPLKSHPHYSVVKAGQSVVFVSSENASLAKSKAESYLRSELHFEPTACQGIRLTKLSEWQDQGQKSAYVSAQKHGISVETRVVAADTFSGSDYSLN